jgi:hypothetical protein
MRLPFSETCLRELRKEDPEKIDVLFLIKHGDEDQIVPIAGSAFLSGRECAPEASSYFGAEKAVGA